MHEVGRFKDKHTNVKWGRSMKNFFKKGVAAFAITIAMVSGANAANYIPLDWKAEGDGLAFLDYDTGTEWLKLDQTKGMSINQVSAELGEGGLFDGWRFATALEVQDIVTDLTGYDTSQSRYYYNNRESSPAVQEIVDDFSAQFGWTYKRISGSSWNVEHDYYSYGMYVNEGNVNMAGVRWFKDPMTTQRTRYYSYSYIDYTHESYTLDATAASRGVYLVADGGATLTTQEDMSLVENNANARLANVSAPGAVMAGLGLLSLAGLKRRKSAAR